MLKFKDRLIAFTAGILFGPAVVFAGLESATYISDLVSSNPLSSDLASTADDHLRLIKSTVKTTFPNINNAITVTDEQINAVGASGVTGAANPTGTIGLSAVNGSATTFLRSDGAPALSQAIAPTWTAVHTFSQAAATPDTYGVRLAGTVPFLGINETGAAANNTRWDFGAASEQMQFRIINDAGNTVTNWLNVDRTGTTVDRVAFPANTGQSHILGTTVTTASSGPQLLQVNSGGSLSAAAFYNSSATVPTVWIGSGQTGGNNYVQFYDGDDQDSATGIISTNGTTTTYGTSSDIRLKKNIRPAPSAKDVVSCIEVESYDWKASNEHVRHGFVAQHLNKCASYAVTQGKIWQVDAAKLVPALIKYVQEQDARIAELERAQSRH